jgi:alkylation response protein AidB-like acyl-CoA dehydrogenase
MDFELTADQQLIRRTAAEFTDNEVAPVAGRNSREHRFDTELVAKIAAQGYLGAIVPTQYGGAGLDYVTYALICEEIGRGCSAMRTVISVQTSLVCSTILKWGTEEQRQRYLPRLCSGEWLGCFGLTEPGTGSGAGDQKTRAVQTDDGGWVINGAKMWISLGNNAKLALIFAQTGAGGSDSHKGIACFLVETDQPGFQPQPIEGKMGLWASDTAVIALDDVHAGPDSMLGGVGEGFKVAMTALDSGRYSVAAGCVGICQASLDESVRYAQERTQFDRPIAGFQLVQAMIADMVVRTHAARLLVFQAGAVKDAGRPSTVETSICKYYASEAAKWCSDAAIQIHGGAGYVDDHPVERFYRDARVTTIYEGTSQIQQLIIGRAATGIDALKPMVVEREPARA